jgi:hypothetical protein
VAVAMLLEALFFGVVELMKIDAMNPSFDGATSTRL